MKNCNVVFVIIDKLCLIVVLKLCLNSQYIVIQSFMLFPCHRQQIHLAILHARTHIGCLAKHLESRGWHPYSLFFNLVWSSVWDGDYLIGWMFSDENSQWLRIPQGIYGYPLTFFVDLNYTSLNRASVTIDRPWKTIAYDANLCRVVAWWWEVNILCGKV